MFIWLDFMGIPQMCVFTRAYDEVPSYYRQVAEDTSDPKAKTFENYKKTS